MEPKSAMVIQDFEVKVAKQEKYLGMMVTSSGLKEFMEVNLGSKLMKNRSRTWRAKCA